MSVDHSACIVIGYAVPLRTFFEDLLEHVPEKSHMEKRYDIKTGKEVASIKVIDRAPSVKVKLPLDEFIVSDDPNFDPDCWCVEDDLIESLATSLECDVEVIGDMYNAQDIFVCLSSAIMAYMKGGMGASIKEIVKHQKDLERIGKACKKLLKVDPGVCGVHSVMSVC